jgi:5-methyltetrahydropteroyltriglutamate--homocysteine methyltransferase
VRRSQDRILTTHVGSLVRPLPVIEAMHRFSRSQPYDIAKFESDLQRAVSEVVTKQVNLGIDIPSDGEFGKLGWVRYVTDRFAGIEYKQAKERGLYASVMYYDQNRFPGFYANYRIQEYKQWMPDLDDPVQAPSSEPYEWVCTGRISYRGQKAIQRDIKNFKDALKAAGGVEGFMPCAAPCSVQIFSPSDEYKSEEEYIYAVADALAQEYQEIIDAGLLLQLDDAVLPGHYNPNRPLDEYLSWAQIRIEATNYALKNIPRDRVRYHICWGSQNAPHTWDIPLRDLTALLFKLNVGAYALEAANPRHEHEWMVWESARLPEGTVLIPGLISHATNVVEHPELVAWRIQNFAKLVGRENVIAGTDCGFSQNWNLIRVHPEVQWAKLEALVEGGRLATEKLWS